MTEFPVDYSQSVIQLQAKAPECLQQSQSPEFDLPDGSVRRTFGLESGGEMEERSVIAWLSGDPFPLESSVT